MNSRTVCCMFAVLLMARMCSTLGSQEAWDNLHPSLTGNASDLPPTGEHGGLWSARQYEMHEPNAAHTAILATSAVSFCAVDAPIMCRVAFFGTIGVAVLVMISLAVSQRRAIRALVGATDDTHDGAVDGLEVLDGMEKWSLLSSSADTKSVQHAGREIKPDKHELDRNLEHIRSSIRDAKSRGLSYEDWLEKSMPAEYYAEFIACSRANLKWHELWHWTTLEDIDAEEGCGRKVAPSSSWVQRQLSRLSALRSAHPTKFGATATETSAEPQLEADEQTTNALNESNGLSMPSCPGSSGSASSSSATASTCSVEYPAVSTGSEKSDSTYHSWSSDSAKTESPEPGTTTPEAANRSPVAELSNEFAGSL